MKLNHRKMIKNIFYMMIVIELFAIVLVGVNKYNIVPFENNTLSTLNNGWTYVTTKGVVTSFDFPTRINTEGEHSVTIKRTFSSMDNPVNSIGILTTHQEITAYIDGIIIYRRAIQNEPKQYFNVPCGSILDIIQLPPHLEGKILTLVIKSKYPDYAGQIGNIYAGTQASILLQFIVTNGTSFVLSVIIMVLGLFMLIYHSFIKRLMNTNRSLYYLGWFTLITSLWFLSDNKLSQLFISNTYIISTVVYLSFMTMPIPIMLFLAENDTYYYKKSIPIIIYLILGNDLVLIVLQFFNIIDFHESLGYNRFVLTVLFGYSIVLMWHDLLIHKDKEIKIFLYSSTMLFLFGFIELIIILNNSDYINGNLLRFGFLLFLMILAWDAMRKVADAIKLGEKATMYKYLATRDPLTNCRSRAAYERDLPRIDLNKNVTLFMADMNNLKEINDTYGHHAGDEIVIQCSQCLMKTFGRRVYRIGGDEFLCIEYDLNPSDIEKIIREFSIECEKANEDSPYHFGVSIGFATYDKAIDYTILDTVKRADSMMYEIKEKMKHA